ncbi:MAG: hypothetical protein Q8N99_05350 [Nanoarchaeota archaeon]|nr:hypothetical protein [Nanoarchaeota archaeon]
MKKTGEMIALLVITIIISLSLIIASGDNKITNPACEVNLKNTSWSDYAVLELCNLQDKDIKQRSRIEYDSNNCSSFVNITITEELGGSCNYCSSNIISENTAFSECYKNNTRSRIKYFIDYNYENCCVISGLTSDCEILKPEYNNITETEDCKQFDISITPIEGIYNKKLQNFQIVSEVNVSRLEFIDYYDKKPSWRLLCKNCDDYKKKMIFNDGFHNISVKGSLFNGRYSIEESGFLVDTKKPEIMTSRINTLGYTNGSFSINYSESNLKEIILFYKDKSIKRDDCLSGKNMRCDFYADLASIDGETIFYRYNITDISLNSYISKNFIAVVDTIPPVIKRFNYTSIPNGISFNIELVEDNFKDISYIDNSVKNPRWKTICSRLNFGFCQKTMAFPAGNHNLTIKFSDKAGNYIIREI